MNPALPACRIAVIGGGWAGIAAAVSAGQQGAKATLFEMAGQLGGRSRSLSTADAPPFAHLDNGQHILIGAYSQSLALMQSLGVDTAHALLRTPLQLRYAHRKGLHLPGGPPLLSFARGVMAYRGWPLGARLRLLTTATGWLLRGFHCPPSWCVQTLCAKLPDCINKDLIDPLCVAALNTPASQASAQVFLRVLQDALFSGPGSADLLLPRQPLSALLAEPAQAWLQNGGGDLRLGRRIRSLTQSGLGWDVDGELFDQVILACSAVEAARLCAELNPAWSALAAQLRYEPIITVYLHSPGSTLPAPMLAMQDGPDAPAQFAFDLGRLSLEQERSGAFAFVISGAAAWVARGLAATGEQVLAQALRELDWQSPPQVYRVLAEKRATFACTPGLQRPPREIAPGLQAAGDYVQGPYPATLEGAVRHGMTAGLQALKKPG